MLEQAVLRAERRRLGDAHDRDLFADGPDHGAGLRVPDRFVAVDGYQVVQFRTSPVERVLLVLLTVAAALIAAAAAAAALVVAADDPAILQPLFILGVPILVVLAPASLLGPVRGRIGVSSRVVADRGGCWLVGWLRPGWMVGYAACM